MLVVLVRPGARRSAIQGVDDDGTLRVQLAAPARENRANEELIRFLAEALGLAKREVRLVGGHTARHKRVEVAVAPATLARWLAAMRASTPPSPTPECSPES
jgi:uncharacterized protein (TIGR00251 family)